MSGTKSGGRSDPGDEILLIHLYGSGPNIGVYEFLKVGQIIGNKAYFTTIKSRYYGASTQSDSGVGSTQTVAMYRVPNYNNVTINAGGILTGTAFDKYKYGVLAFRVAGTLTGSGTIHMNAKGFQGSGVVPGNITGYGPGGDAGNRGNGGGGGYATDGLYGGWATYDGAAGSTYGDPLLDSLLFGSGGGIGGPLKADDGSWGCNISGNSGGGTIFVISQTISFGGTVQAIGGAAPYAGCTYGGAGSGGSVRIEGKNITLNTVSAAGGAGFVFYGNTFSAGGQGRIAVYYENTNFQFLPFTLKHRLKLRKIQRDANVFHIAGASQVAS